MGTRRRFECDRWLTRLASQLPAVRERFPRQFKVLVGTERFLEGRDRLLDVASFEMDAANQMGGQTRVASHLLLDHRRMCQSFIEPAAFKQDPAKLN
jgi:hypothetical protein